MVNVSSAAMANTPLRNDGAQQGILREMLSPQSNSLKRINKCKSMDMNLVLQSPNLPEAVENEVDTARQRRRHSRNFINPPLSDKADDEEFRPTAKWSRDEVLQHYSKCMKLSQENKINHKNAFHLQLIEHMGEMLQTDDNLNFRVAGGAIYAGAKIYASRVDAIHSETYRVLGSLYSGDKDDNNEDDNNDNNEDPQRKTRKRKKNFKSLENNKSNLRHPITSIYASEERGRSRNAAIDLASCASLNSNRLPVTNDGIQYDFESRSTEANCASQPQEGDDLDDPFKNVIPASPLNPNELCDIACTELDFNVSQDGLGSLDLSHSEDDAVMTPTEDLIDDTIDNCVDLDKDHVADDCGDGESVFNSQSEQVTDARVPTLSNPLDIAELVVTAAPGAEYSYFNTNALSVFDGPKQWLKHRSLRSRITTSTAADKQTENEAPSEKPRSKRRKTTDEKKDILKKGKLTPDKRVQPQKMSKAKIDSFTHSMRDNLLLEYVDSATENLTKSKLTNVSLKPITSDQIKQGGVQLDSHDVCALNYADNDYCPATTGDDYGDDDNNSGDMFPDNTECFFPDFSQATAHSPDDGQSDYNALVDGDHLIDQPRKVEKVQIHFAKRAKRIDVRRLKSAMWNLIKPEENTPASSGSGEPSESDAPTSTSTSSNEIEKNEENNSSKQPQLFSEMYSSLPGKVSSNMWENMSVPIAFTCLLHLANEKELKIEGMPTLSDLKISHGL